MTYIANSNLNQALALIEPTDTLIKSSRVDGVWFLTVKQGA